MTRQELRHQGEAMLRTLFGSAAQPAVHMPQSGVVTGPPRHIGSMVFRVDEGRHAVPSELVAE